MYIHTHVTPTQYEKCFKSLHIYIRRVNYCCVCECPGKHFTWGNVRRTGFHRNNAPVKHTHSLANAANRTLEAHRRASFAYSPAYIRKREGNCKNSPCYYRCHSFGDPGVYFRHKEASFQSGRATPNFRVPYAMVVRARVPENARACTRRNESIDFLRVNSSKSVLLLCVSRTHVLTVSANCTNCK